MNLIDVNPLVYVHRSESPHHPAYYAWWTADTETAEPFAVPSLVLSGFLRVVTHASIFRTPTPLKIALQFVQDIREHAHFVSVEPGPRHWEIFTSLCRAVAVREKVVPDAYLAAIAIESGCELISADRDFARFPGLSWRHPLK